MLPQRRVNLAKAVERRAPHTYKKINGLTYGDSAAQGFVKDGTFYHPVLGFAFKVPNGAKVSNGTSQVAMSHSNGSIVVFDVVKDSAKPSPYNFLTQKILAGKTAQGAERITINGMNAATAVTAGKVGNTSGSIRVVVIEWEPGKFFRFQVAMPNNLSSAYQEELRRATYSFRRLSSSEKRMATAKTLRVISAPSGATVQSMAAKMDVEGDKLANFLVLNGLSSNATIRAGEPYKIVVD